MQAIKADDTVRVIAVWRHGHVGTVVAVQGEAVIVQFAGGSQCVYLPSEVQVVDA